MRISKLFGKTQREVPAEADTISHQLLLRAGMIHQVAAGVYSYLPLAWRVLNKIENIIREEMDKAGGQELMMPVLQPLELWQETGREVAFGKGLFTLSDRRARTLVLGQTHEKVTPQLVGIMSGAIVTCLCFCIKSRPSSVTSLAPEADWLESVSLI